MLILANLRVEPRWSILQIGKIFRVVFIFFLKLNQEEIHLLTKRI